MTEANERTEPWKDPIVAEVRRHREALFAEAGYACVSSADVSESDKSFPDTAS